MEHLDECTCQGKYIGLLQHKRQNKRSEIHSSQFSTCLLLRKRTKIIHIQPTFHCIALDGPLFFPIVIVHREVNQPYTGQWIDKTKEKPSFLNLFFFDAFIEVFTLFFDIHIPDAIFFCMLPTNDARNSLAFLQYLLPLSSSTEFNLLNK